MVRAQVASQSLPDAVAHLEVVVGIDADETHAAKDEWHDAGAEVQARGVADTADDSILLHAARQRAQRAPAKRIDCALPQCRLQRLRSRGHFGAGQYLARTKLAQILTFP